MNGDVDQPMGNAELRLTLAGIESEVADVKDISLRTHAQAKKTNGTVMWHTKIVWLSMGALPLLTIWSMWLTKEVLDAREPQQAQIQAAVMKALDEYDGQLKQ